MVSLAGSKLSIGLVGLMGLKTSLWVRGGMVVIITRMGLLYLGSLVLGYYGVVEVCL